MHIHVLYMYIQCTMYMYLTCSTLSSRDCTNLAITTSGLSNMSTTCVCTYTCTCTVYVHTCMYAYDMYMYNVHVDSVVGSSPTRGSSFFLGKVTALSVLCCFALFVCLFDLACFFLSSFSSLIKNMYIQYMYMQIQRTFLQSFSTCSTISSVDGNFCTCRGIQPVT